MTYQNAAAPGWATEGRQENDQFGDHPDSTGETPAADFFRTSYAVLVRGKAVRRHLYFSLPAAERTVKRAEARGDRAELVLVRLVPVDARHLDATIGGDSDD